MCVSENALLMSDSGAHGNSECVYMHCSNLEIDSYLQQPEFFVKDFDLYV